MPLRRFRLVVPVLATLLAAPLLAQDGDGLSRAGQAALERLEAGDAAGALALLEPQRAGLTAVDRSLLGSVYLELGRAGDALDILRPLADAETADPAVLYTAGRAAVAAGETAVAVGYLQRSIDLVPRSPALRELGLLRGAQGAAVPAYRLLRAWLAIRPDDLEVRSAAAALALKLERPLEAEQLLAGSAPATPELAVLHAQLRMQKADPRGALELLEPLVADHPPEMTFDVYRMTADAMIQVGRAVDAALLLRGGPEGPRLALLLAEAQHRSGDAAAAVATLRPLAAPLLARGGEVEGALPIALAYGRALVATGDAAAARPFLEIATELDPTSSVAWKALADAQLAAGDRQAAQTSLGRFRELSEDAAARRQREEMARFDPVARTVLAVDEALQRGDREAALELVRRETAIDPRPRLQALAGRLLIDLGRLDEARALAAQVSARHPADADAAYLRAMVAMAGDETEAARVALREALAHDPDHLAAMSDLAVLEMVAGHRDEARRLLERVLELHPDDARARRHLDELADG